MKKGIVIKPAILLAILLIANVCFSQFRKPEKFQFPDLPNMFSPHDNIQVFILNNNFTITLRDNVNLDCAKYFPNAPNPNLPNGYPGVIICHGFGDRKEALESLATVQASFGYCVYIYSMRGQGFSGGESNLISIVEAQDLIEFVNYVKHDQSSGVDSSKVMIMGGSQGGIIPYMAICNGMNVKAVISVLSSPKFASNWIENGCIKLSLLWSLSYPADTVRYSPLVMSFQNWIYSNSPDKWDSLLYWLPKDRDFILKVPQNNIPVQIENAWQDKFFNTDGNLSTIPQVISPKRYYFGAVKGHGGDSSLTEDQWHKNFFNEWFNYWLFNINNGILTRPKFHYALTTFPTTIGMWSFVHDSSSVWPPVNTSNMRLYLLPQGRLGPTPNNNQNSFDTLVNNVSSSLTMQTAVNEAFTGTVFSNLFQKSERVYQTDVLTSDLKMIGTPVIGLDYSSNASESQFNFQIYEVNGTTSKLVTRANYTDRRNILNSRKSVVFNGQAHGHIFKAGSKIKIIITNLDTAPDDFGFFRTNPFVLPDLNNGISKFYYSNLTYLSMPVIQTTTVIPNISSEVPKEYNLGQNYPNPFNPSTTINYSIPVNNFVVLKVYDISGKEIATLINSQKSAGFYSVRFNSDSYNLSSGVYFYKLIAGEFTSVKKFVLIK